MERRGGLAMADDRFELRLTQETSGIRQEIATLRAEVATRTELEAVRQEISALRESVATRGELEAVRQEITELRTSMAPRTELEATRREMAAGFARLERQIADSRVESIKWSFLFWTGQCLTIIGFLVVFLRNR